MGSLEIFQLLKKTKTWMSNKDIQKIIPQSANSINRITRELHKKFPNDFKKKVVRTDWYKTFYYRYIYIYIYRR